jgi:hypothetical protein
MDQKEPAQVSCRPSQSGAGALHSLRPIADAARRKVSRARAVLPSDTRTSVPSQARRSLFVMAANPYPAGLSATATGGSRTSPYRRANFLRAAKCANFVPIAGSPLKPLLGAARPKVVMFANTQDQTLEMPCRPTSDPLPTIIDGIPLQIKRVNKNIDRPGLHVQPDELRTDERDGDKLQQASGHHKQQPQEIRATTRSKNHQVSHLAKSRSLFKATSASHPGISNPTGITLSQTEESNIASVKVELPKQLPSRLTTLQKACTKKQFKPNPTGCPKEAKFGYAKINTPLLNNPLTGPAYFVSHGNEAFPQLIVVLQGENGLVVELVGDTFISKAGITSSTFAHVPDVPVSSFELTLPEGKYSALAANGNLCALTKTVSVKKKVTVKVHGRKRTVTRTVKQTVPSSLTMPTEFIAQNGAELKQDTKIEVTGCPKAVVKHKAKKASKKGKKRK